MAPGQASTTRSGTRGYIHNGGAGGKNIAVQGTRHKKGRARNVVHLGVATDAPGQSDWCKKKAQSTVRRGIVIDRAAHAWLPHRQRKLSVWIAPTSSYLRHTPPLELRVCFAMRLRKSDEVILSATGSRNVYRGMSRKTGEYSLLTVRTAFRRWWATSVVDILHLLFFRG